ncbi:MAG TPA: TlpA disulfide reductase family protein [Ktedonobacterales bacterium]
MRRRTSTRFSSVERRLRRTTVAGWLRSAAIACAALAVILLVVARALAPSTVQARASVGQAAAPFTLTAAQHDQTLAQPILFAGHGARPTLLVFFNTLCVHCVAGVQAAHAAGVGAPGQSPVDVIYVDAPGENAEITGQYMARLSLDAPVLLDKGARVASRYGVSYYPSIVLVDARGVIRAVWIGAPSASQLRSAIARSQ